MGFIGLFLGPAVMAALIALWREWTEAAPVGVARALPARHPAGGRPAARSGGRSGGTRKT
jgi:hypothetical protein